jgi:hypothetical protein
MKKTSEKVTKFRRQKGRKSKHTFLNLIEEFRNIGRIERRNANSKLVEKDSFGNQSSLEDSSHTKRPPIDRFVMSSSQKHFRSQILWSSTESTRLGKIRIKLFR